MSHSLMHLSLSYRALLLRDCRIRMVVIQLLHLAIGAGLVTTMDKEKHSLRPGQMCGPITTASHIQGLLPRGGLCTFPASHQEYQLVLR